MREAAWTDGGGRTAYYVVHLVSVVAEDGSIPYIVEMSTDITAAKRFKKTKSRVYLVYQVILRLQGLWPRLKSAHQCGRLSLPGAKPSHVSHAA